MSRKQQTELFRRTTDQKKAKQWREARIKKSKTVALHKLSPAPFALRGIERGEIQSFPWKRNIPGYDLYRAVQILMLKSGAQILMTAQQSLRCSLKQFFIEPPLP